MGISFRSARFAAVLAIGLAAIPSLLHAWGYWGHPRINRAAVLALPPVMRDFFYCHVDYMTQEAVIPDVRKYALSDKAERPRHYIDIEDYEKPIAQIPHAWDEAKVAYSTVDLDKRGRLPWYVQEMMGKLTQAFKDRKKEEILFLAADLGHYLGDAHMPLHTSTNHDGQLTDQKGVHALWESNLPERFGNTYNFRVAEATLVADPVADIWRIIGESHAAKDTVLAVDKKLRTELGDNIFEKDAQGAVRKNQYGQPYFSTAYATRFHQDLHGMVQRRMRGAIQATANYWYTAWVSAGKPDLTGLDSEALRRLSQPAMAEELRLLQQGQLIDISSSKEF